MKHEVPRGRIEVTTHQDTCRVFIERVEPPLDPGIEWAISHPQQAEEYCQRTGGTITWWQAIKQLVRDSW